MDCEFFFSCNKSNSDLCYDEMVLWVCSFEERTCYNVEVFISHRVTQAECQVPAVEKVSHIQ